jgi:spermidine synthase
MTASRTIPSLTAVLDKRFALTSDTARTRDWTLVYAIATLLGAFLIFQVQPVISKCVLPWFGGTPSVWTTCLLFFQVLLFAGYLYAHLLRTYLSIFQQGLVHAACLAIAACSLPIEPTSEWKPIGTEDPTWALLTLLAAHVAVPYFVLSSTGPLVQAWLGAEKQTRSVYRLYALSNIGSLTALLSYPFLVEPLLSVSAQSKVWSTSFCFFAIIMSVLAIRFGLRRRTEPVGNGREKSVRYLFCKAPEGPLRGKRYRTLFSSSSITKTDYSIWVILPAFASIMLLAVTNYVCQDIAVVPFLWILPLSLYLVSFIVTFDSPAWYRPKPIAVLTFASLLGMNFAERLPETLQLPLAVVAALAALLGVCLICHGEVAARQPAPRHVTIYYTMISLGGALGGLIVALLCPFLFDDYRELHLGSILAMGLSLATFFATRNWRATATDYRQSRIATPIVLVWVLFSLFTAIPARAPQTIDQRRNFFGVARVDQDQQLIRLVHGGTYHGLQFRGEQSNTPTSYYGRQSGVGKALTAMQSAKRELRIGVVGLGCGVLTAYGREGETWEIFEINPDMLAIAQEHFTFLRDCPAVVNHQIGDGRLLLERMEATKFDLLVIDAFNSDSIPAHLLTQEAMKLYNDRLADNGVIAIHLSNNHLDLLPLAHRLADSVDLQSREVYSQADDQTATRPARWVLATNDKAFWDHPLLVDAKPCDPNTLESAPLWTDQHHNLASVLSWW